MGTSSPFGAEGDDKKDHPHAYGDKADRFTHENTHLGSSPRVWGQEPSNLADTDGIRIIPTRMGTSQSPCLS